MSRSCEIFTSFLIRFQNLEMFGDCCRIHKKISARCISAKVESSYNEYFVHFVKHVIEILNPAFVSSYLNFANKMELFFISIAKNTPDFYIEHRKESPSIHRC